MRKQELKAKIKQEFEAVTPNLSSKIIDSCKNASVEDSVAIQAPKKPSVSVMFKRLSLLAACLLIFVVGISVFVFIRNSGGGDDIEPTIEASVYLDVNPSVEIRLDGDGKVVECVAANEDAKGIIKDLSLVGTTVDNAIKDVVGSMHANGYITAESSSILVSVCAKDAAKGDTLLADLTQNINEAFRDTDIVCSIITQNIELSDELVKRANENGVSVGKMHLVDKMLEELGDIDEELDNLLNMSIGELDKLIEELTPPSDEPPTENPPSDDPPTEDPPSVEPPKEDPPSDNPPKDDPPSVEPPNDNPPNGNPPNDNPPNDNPPNDEPPSDDPKSFDEFVLLVAGEKGIDVNDIEVGEYTPWFYEIDGKTSLVCVVRIKLNDSQENLLFILDPFTNEILDEKTYVGDDPFWMYITLL